MKRLTERDEYGNVFCPRCLELCKGLPGSRFGENGKCSYCAVLEVLLFALAAYEDTGLTPEEINDLKSGKSAPQWISVDDRMPESFISVLGYMIDADPFPPVRECYTIGNAFFFPALQDFRPVSHWMPLPNPPDDSDDIPEGATFA